MRRILEPRWLRAAVFAFGLPLALAGCGTLAPSVPGPSVAAPSVAVPSVAFPPIATPAPTPPAASGAPGTPDATGTVEVPATGFAFDAESVLGYYESIGFACVDPVPAAEPPLDHLQRWCERTESNGRVRVVGVFTDAQGRLVDGYASIRGAPGEQMVPVEEALEPLAGYLGAMLGEARGGEMLRWLAGSLGDEYVRATSTDGSLVVVTYRVNVDGQLVLFVEVATPEFWEAAHPELP
ncbi:MAG TPA: hypothetical protein VNL94_08185 [Candidatus Binatia bacterium]|nr:hypothetical protein [Candidatus Binatia bacterium]